MLLHDLWSHRNFLFHHGSCQNCPKEERNSSLFFYSIRHLIKLNVIFTEIILDLGEHSHYTRIPSGELRSVMFCLVYSDLGMLYNYLALIFTVLKASSFLNLQRIFNVCKMKSTQYGIYITALILLLVNWDK